MSDREDVGQRLRSAFNRLVDPEERDQEELTRAAERCGAVPIERCGDRQQVTVNGRIRSVVLRPRNETPKLVAELYDGTGVVALVWLGRHGIPGIEPGQYLRATGRVAVVDGKRVMFNPRYELLTPESLS